MIILVVGIVLVALSLFFRKELPPYWGFVFAFLIMGFQEGVQGDFMVYKEIFNGIGRGTIEHFGSFEKEPFWDFLFGLFSSIMPFFLFVIILTGFEIGVLYIVEKKYGSKKFSWLAPILFFFTASMMLVQMKAMRQGLAVELVVLSYYVISQRIYLFYGILIYVLAYFTHNSALIALPIIVLHLIITYLTDIDRIPCQKSQKNNFLFPTAMTALFIFVYSLKNTSLFGWLDAVGNSFETSDNRLYHYFVDDQGYAFEISSLIVWYDAVMVFLSSWLMQTTSWRNRLLCIVSIIGCYGEALLFGMGSLPRLMMYYHIFNIITYPIIADKIAQKYGMVGSLIFSVFVVGYAVKTSLPVMLETGNNQFGTYHFVFFRYI